MYSGPPPSGQTWAVANPPEPLTEAQLREINQLYKSFQSVAMWATAEVETMNRTGIRGGSIAWKGRWSHVPIPPLPEEVPARAA